MNVCPWMAGNCAIVYIMEVERRCRRCPAIFYCLLLFIRKNNDRNRVYVIVSTDFTCVLSHEKTYFQFEFHPPPQNSNNSTESTNTIERIFTSPFPPKIKFLRSPDNPKYRARETRLICEWQRRSVNPRSQPSSPSQERKALVVPCDVEPSCAPPPPTPREEGREGGGADSAPIFTQRYDVVCFRGNAQIYSGTAEHVARAALHKSAVRGVQELRKVSL